MSKKRKMAMVPLTDKQREALKALFDAVHSANGSLSDAAILAQVWEDGIVATLLTQKEIYGVQKVLKPSHPWRTHASAKERMASLPCAT